MSYLDEDWFDPLDEADPAFPPLPRADRRVLLDPVAWRAAERDCAVDLARAAQAIGRLDGLLASLDAKTRRGLIARLAFSEVVSMLWAAGTPIPQDVLIRDLADAPSSVDLEALALARWAIGRLQGRGRLEALRDFLGLHRAGQGRGDSDLLRPTRDRGVCGGTCRTGGVPCDHPGSVRMPALAAYRMPALAAYRSVAGRAPAGSDVLGGTGHGGQRGAAGDGADGTGRAASLDDRW